MTNLITMVNRKNYKLIVVEVFALPLLLTGFAVFASGNDPSVDLSTNRSIVNQGESFTLSWTSYNTNSCIASGGWSGSKSLSGSQIITPAFNRTYTITCSHFGVKQASDSVTVTVQTEPPLSVDLTISSGVIQQGNSAVLSWASTNADFCTASDGWSGNKSISGSETVSPSRNTGYTLTCYNSRGQVYDHVSLSVVQQSLPTVSLMANPENVTNGNSSSLIWNTSNADTCTASGGWSGNKSTAGSQTVFLSNNTTYTLTCSNPIGQASDSVTVLVNQSQGVSVSLSASPLSITHGNSSILSWSSSNANTCTAYSGWSGSKSLSGSQTVFPSVNTTYTLTCQNSMEQTDTESVTVLVDQVQNFPSVFLTANPTSINQGNSSFLGWNASNADYCTASGGWSGSKSISGSQTITPYLNTTYTLTCYNSRGQTSDSVTVFVNQSQATPTLVFSAAPTVINRGDTSYLTWTSNNTTSCIAGGGWSGTKTVSGSQAINPLTQTNYALTCFGSQGSVTAEALVAVLSPSLEQSSLGASCGISDANVLTGEDVVFSAFQSGGRAPYTYTWSGAAQGSGISRTMSFGTVGTKTATVTITDADGRIASGSCITNVSERAVTKPAQPTEEVLGEQAPTCEVKKVFACSDGENYNIDENGDAYDKDGKLIYSGADNNTATTTPDDTAENERNGRVASLFFNEAGGLSGLGFLLVWYFLILLTIGFAVTMYRLVKGKSRVNY
ncbi:MAG: hypothetical protein HYT12_02660 [Candidatus Liptonbacteria bacterium]|nr:hypothetical protein [Candidatus Liptonbacteria bacterium]